MANKDDYQYEPVAGNEESPTAEYDAGNEKVDFHQSPNNMSSDSTGPSDRKFLYIAACVANLSAFVCGTTLGWTSPEIPKMQSSGPDNPLGVPITDSQKSWIGSILPVGAALAPFAAGIAADKIGRKNTILIGTLPFLAAFVIFSVGSTPTYMFLGRFLCGLAVGSIFTVLPMYIGEISEDEVRGSLGSFMQLFITVGLLFSYVLGPYISVKLFNITCIIIPCVFLVSFYMFIPESPYYLIKKNKEEAEKSLMKLRAKSVDSVQKELDDVKASVEEALANKASFMDIFKSKGLTKALIISIGLVSLQQFSGINIILFYAEGIFTDAGSTIPPDISTIIIGVVQVVASAATPALVEKRGKRFLLLLSAIGMALSQGTLALFFYLKNSGFDVSAIALLPIVSLVAYIITYCLGFGPLPWAVMGELFPGNIKSAASTVTAAACWFLGFIITQYFSFVSNLIGASGSFGIFAVCCLGAALFVYKYLPETSGKSLQEIQDILSGNAAQ